MAGRHKEKFARCLLGLPLPCVFVRERDRDRGRQRDRVESRSNIFLLKLTTFFLSGFSGSFTQILVSPCQMYVSTTLFYILFIFKNEFPKKV